MIYRTVTVEAELCNSIIEAEAELCDSIIEVDAELYTKIKTYGGEVEFYDGPYEVTPSQDQQTVHINGKTAVRDITINSIPSNYGLITWDGSVLTVS